MTHKIANAEQDISKVLKDLSQSDFKSFGLEQLAYIRPVTVGNIPSYAIHSANGTKISVADSLEEAIVTARYRSLEPVAVH